MDLGEMVMRWSIWWALCCYPAGLAIGLAKSRRGRQLALWVWSLGGLAYLVHVVTSFHIFYRWSHDTAYAETARQTAELVGRESGFGIYLNYLFTGLWFADVLWSWVSATTYLERPRGLHLGLHAFFLFMILNGAFVFVQGPQRWLGASITLVGVVLWWRSWRS